jgi:hypothetical protein
MSSVDGFYIGYFTGSYGTSLGVFTLSGDVIVGADVGGGVYDGNLKLREDARQLIGTIHFRQSTGGTTITGARNELPISYETDVRLTCPLDSVPFHTISTMAGQVNVRFEKVRDL